MKKELSVLESEFIELLSAAPHQVEPLLELIAEVDSQHNPEVAIEWSTMLMQELQSRANVRALFAVIKARQTSLTAKLSPTAVRELLLKSCKDRLIKAMLEEISFEKQPLAQAIAQLDLLLSLSPGTLVLSRSWGIGRVKRLDDFCKRVTVDFTTKKGHSLNFAVAATDLILAPEHHLLTRHAVDPDLIANMVQQEPAEIVRLALQSFGNLPVAILEEYLTNHKIIQPEHWKAFWDGARKALRNDPLVILPAKRADCIMLRAQAEDYGAPWFAALAQELSPDQVLALITEFEEQHNPTELKQDQIDVIEDRLQFALKNAHNTNFPLYARLTMLSNRLGILPEMHTAMLDHLWEDEHYIIAALSLTIREIGELISLLLSSHLNTATDRLLAAIPRMPYSMLSELLAQQQSNPAAGAECTRLLSQPHAPHTLINWVLRNHRNAGWPLPPTADLLHHGIATVEASLAGENLRMQNAVRQLFEQPKWLEQEFADLDPAQRRFIFERIQASTVWENISQRKLINLMLKLDPDLLSSKRTIAQPAVKHHLTSWRSLAERKNAYKHLVEVEMPKNSSDIAIARSYGDLRENFEYQSAKDYQSQLLQRQAKMQQELDQIVGTDFSTVSTAKVAPGTTVRLSLANGETLTYTILGEWDFDEKLNIISSRAGLAELLIGLTPGTHITLPGADGERAAVIEAILPLDETIRAWISATP